MPATLDFSKAEIPEPPTEVYHGTRVSPDVLKKEGLHYPTESEFMEMIRGAMGRAGLSFEEWKEGQVWLECKGRLNQTREMRETHRQKIWTTARLETAWSYADRAPEIVSEAVRNEIYRLYWRRKTVVDMAENAVCRAMEGIGRPVVVVLDARKIGALGGHNEPIARYISPDAIVRILER